MCRKMKEREKEKAGDRTRVAGLFIFFEPLNVEALCFLEGVVQKQPAGERCLLYLIETESVTP